MGIDPLQSVEVDAARLIQDEIDASLNRQRADEAARLAVAATSETGNVVEPAFVAEPRVATSRVLAAPTPELALGGQPPPVAEPTELEAAEDRLLVLSERDREKLIHPTTGERFTDEQITEGMLNALGRKRERVEETLAAVPVTFTSVRSALEAELEGLDTQIDELDPPRQASEEPRIAVVETSIDDGTTTSLLFGRGGWGTRYQRTEFSDGSVLIVDTEYDVNGRGAGLTVGMEVWGVGIELGADVDLIQQIGNGRAYILHPGWEEQLGTELRRQIAIDAYMNGTNRELEALQGLDEMNEYLRQRALLDTVWEGSYDDVQDVNSADTSLEIGLSGEILGVYLDVGAGIGGHQLLIQDPDTGAESRRLSITEEASAGLGAELFGTELAGEIASEQALTINTNAEGDLESVEIEVVVAIEGSGSIFNPTEVAQTGANEIVNTLLENGPQIIVDGVPTVAVDVIDLEYDQSNSHGLELRFAMTVPNNHAGVEGAVSDFVSNPSRATASELLAQGGEALPTVSVAAYTVEVDSESAAVELELLASLGIGDERTVTTRQLIDGVIVGPDGVDHVGG